MIRCIAAFMVLMLAMVGVACQAPVPQATSTPTAAPTRPPAASPSGVASPSGAASPSAAASPAISASPSVAAASPTPRAAASPAVAPPPTGSSRVEVLNAANAAAAQGDLATATGLYERVLNTPPTAGESSAATVAINEFAGFRDMVVLLGLGREGDAKAQLDALQQADANSPFARLGSQLWDQYGMIGSLRGACAQVQPQITSQAGPVLAVLTGLGVSVDPQSLCGTPPTS